MNQALPRVVRTVWARAVMAALLVALLALAWARPLDTWAAEQVDAGLKRALATYAAARTLNAVLSTVRSVSVSVGVGVGASVHPGAVLEPVDDLVEQFSALVLAATLSFAAQKLLLEVGAAWPLGLALTVALGAWLAWWWRAPPPRWLHRLALGLLCLRLAVPLLALGSEGTYQLVMAGEYQQAQATLQQTPLPEAAPAANAGLAERIKRWWADSTDVAGKVEQLKARADALVAHMVRLAAVFVLQTVVLPLLFLALLLAVYRHGVAALSGPAAR